MSKMTIEQHHNHTGVTLKFVGALTREASRTLEVLSQELSLRRGEQLFFDFQDLRHISGEGMMLLTILCAKARALGCQITVLCLNNAHKAVLDLTRLTTIMQIRDSSLIQGQDFIRWMKPIETVHCRHAPAEATNINVHGRQPTSPTQGFGRMWLRSYRIELPGQLIQPVELMKEWKTNFSVYWPPGNHFFTPVEGIFPGAVGLINLSMPLGLNLATGAVVIYEDETSFTLMTVQGHMFSGFINFSTYTEDGKTFAQTQALIRPNDLVYEMSFWLGFGPREEDAFWAETLRNLANSISQPKENILPGEKPQVELSSQLIDPRLQWRFFWNICYNAGAYSGIYQVFIFFRRLFSSSSKAGK